MQSAVSCFLDVVCDMPDEEKAHSEDWDREARDAAELYGERFHHLASVPLAYYIDDVLSLEECAHVIDVARPRLGAAHVSGSKSGYVPAVVAAKWLLSRFRRKKPLNDWNARDI